MPQMTQSLESVRIWSTAYQARIKSAHGRTTGDECVVCGRPTANTKNTVYIWASPATGRPIPAADVATSSPALEVSGYPVGSECLKKNPALRACVQSVEGR